MNQKPNYKKGIRREIIQLLYENTAVSYTALKIASRDWKNTHKKLREMERDGIITILHSKKQDEDSLVVLRAYITNAVQYEIFFDTVYHGSYDYEVVRHMDNVKRKKYMRDSEAMCFSRYSNIATLRTEKIMLDNPEQSTCKLTLDTPYFYSSREIKNCVSSEGFLDYDKISYTRVNGVILSAGGIYPVYNIRTSLIEWSKNSEIKFQNYLRYLLEQRIEECEAYNNGYDINKTVILTKDYDVGLRMLTYDKQYGKRNGKSIGMPLIGIDYTYEHMYLLSCQVEDMKLLEIMTTPMWETKMRGMYLDKDTREESKMTSVTCDGVKNNTYIFFFCIPDIVRFKQFIDRAIRENTPERFVVYCFRHQQSFVESAVDGFAKVKTTDIYKLHKEYMVLYENELTESGKKLFKSNTY